MGNYYICCGTMWIPVDNGTVPCPPQPPATSCDGATTGQECVIQNQTCPVGTPPHLCRCDSLSMINIYKHRYSWCVSDRQPLLRGLVDRR
jgi:hypothetical protein